MNKTKICIVSLFITGLLIVLYPYFIQPINQQLQRIEANNFKQLIERIPIEKRLENIVAAKKCNEAIFTNEHNFHDPFTAEFNQDDYEACGEVVFPDEQVASLEIPKLDLLIPIYLGATPDTLAKGVGQVTGSSLPIGGVSSHTVLAAHRGMATKAMFRDLNELEVGDEIYIQTVHDRLTYVVYESEVILPHETDNLVVFEEEDLASLITCHPYRQNSHRLVVHTKRVE